MRDISVNFKLLLLAGLVQASTSAPVSGTGLQVWPCDSSSAYQSFSLQTLPFPHHNIRLGGATSALPYTGLNINTLGFSNATGGILNVWVDSPSNPWGQDFGYTGTQIQSQTNLLCAGTSNSTGVLPAGTPVVQVPCSNGAAASFAYNATTGLLVWGLDPSLCLDAGSSTSCAAFPAGQQPPYCNTSLSAGARAADLLSRLLPSEKASFLAASNNGFPRLGVPPLTYGEALHGVLSGCGAPAPPTPSGFISSGCPTSFPTGLAMGATFNRSLWRAVGTTIGTEARALYNQRGVAALMLFTPDANPCRDARWGRCMEVPSESPYHSGEYAAAYIAGLQGLGQGGFVRAVSMVKHFAGYDQEGNFGVHDRTHFCAPLSTQHMVEYFWPPFKAAITQGGALGIMCSANGYGLDGQPGQPSCSHGEFNIGVLRGQWGFEGAQVTDGNGVGDLWTHYGTANATALNCGGTGALTPTAAVRVGLAGGVDVELGETLNNYALAALAEGSVTAADIDTALLHTLPMLFRLGLMDPPESVPWAALGPADVDTAGARALALEAAAQAVVLLRNNASLLPLTLGAGPGGSNLTRLAVIGPSMDSADIMLANYHGSNTVAAAHTPLAALAAAAAAAGISLASAPGCDTVLCPTQAGFPAALAAAAGAQAIVYIGGGGPWRGGAGAFNATEGEEYDRTSIGLPGQQEALLGALLDTGVPVVVVLLRGGPIGLSPGLLADPRLHTLVDLAYPGEMGGSGLASVLLGLVAPSGRLSTTVYAPSFTATRDITDYNLASSEGVTHMYYTGVPQWEFGYGLSTTTWELAWVGGGERVLRVPGEGGTQGVQYACNVTNTGQRTSDIAVLAFVYPQPEPGGAIKRLFDFARAAAVAPGHSVLLYFSASALAAASVGGGGEQALQGGAALRVAIGAPGIAVLEGVLRVDTGAGGGRVVVAPRPW